MLPNFFESWYSQYNNIRHTIIKNKMSECLARHWKFILKIHSGLDFLTSWWNKFKIHITNIKQVNSVHKLPRSMRRNITGTEFLPRPSFCFACASYSMWVFAVRVVYNWGSSSNIGKPWGNGNTWKLYTCWLNIFNCRSNCYIILVCVLWLITIHMKMYFYIVLLFELSF